MHARLIVLADTRQIPSPERARTAVDGFLEVEGFAGYGGLFADPPADWYEIGGRWRDSLVDYYQDTLAGEEQVDALVMDQVLWDACISKLKQYPVYGTLEDLRAGQCYVYKDEPYKEVDESLVGKVWAVVVDFHY